MSLTEVRSHFHALIDEVENPLILNKFFEIMKESSKPSKMRQWDTLSALEKDEVIAASEESKKVENLVSNKAVMSKYKKWLKK